MFNSFDQIDADFTDLDALSDTNDAEQNQFSQELRVTFIGEFWNYVAGAYYFQQDLDSVSTLSFGEDTEAIAGAFLGLPLDLIFMGTFFPPDGWASDLNEQEHESWAVFGQSAARATGYRRTRQFVDGPRRFCESSMCELSSFQRTGTSNWSRFDQPAATILSSGSD